MASNNSANGGQNQVGEGRGQAKQPFNQQQHSPGLAGGGGDSGAGGGSIRCNKCNVEYSTKEARRLHTCNSILDQHYLSASEAGERTSNSNKSSSPNSPTGLHMTSAEARAAAHENSTSSPPSSFDSASSRSNSPMMDQWGGNGSGGGNGNRKSTSSSSMTSGGSSASNGSNSSNVSSNSVKLIKEKSDKLIIEGRPKLSVTKVSRLDSSTSNSEGNSAKSKQGPTSNSPALPKFKLSTASLSDSKKYNESAGAAELAPSSGGEKHQRPNVNVKASSKNNFESNNVGPSYSGKLKIKLGGGSTTIQSEKSQASMSSDRTSDRSAINHHHNQDGGAAAHGGGSSGGPEGDRGGLAFSFAGKPTYSPSRIEPSNSGGTTVQTKGELLL